MRRESWWIAHQIAYDATEQRDPESGPAHELAFAVDAAAWSRGEKSHDCT